MSGPATTPSASSRLGAALLTAGLLAVLIFVSVHQTRSARARLTASRTLFQVENSVTAKMRLGTLDPRELRAQIALLQRVQPLDPADFAIPMAIGSQYLLLQNAPSAIRWYEKALSLEIRPEIALNLSRAHDMAGDEAEARRYREMAEVLDPRLARSNKGPGPKPRGRSGKDGS